MIGMRLGVRAGIINVLWETLSLFKECIYCEDNLQSRFNTSYNEEIHEMELNEMIENIGENNLSALTQANEEQM